MFTEGARGVTQRQSFPRDPKDDDEKRSMTCELEATGSTKSVDGVLLRNVPVRFRAYLDRNGC